MNHRRKRNTQQSRSAAHVASVCERATESLEVRQLLSATFGGGESEFCLEQRAAPQTIEDIQVLRESGSDVSPTIVWNDRLPAYDLLAGHELITEYEVRLRNESLPVSFSIIALLDDATRFNTTTRTNAESLLRRVNSRTTVEVAPGQTERFSGSIDYELAPGIYSFSVRYRVLNAFGAPFAGSTSNALSSDWSGFSAEEKFTVAPEGESFFMGSPDATAKHTLFAPSVFSNTPMLAWGHVEEAESCELWISRDGAGRVYHESATTDQTLRLNDSFEIGHHRWWVRANFADGSQSAWSKPSTFEVTHRFAVNDLGGTPLPNEPYTFSFAYRGAPTGEVDIRVFRDGATSSRPYLQTTIAAASEWTYELGFPEGTYRFELRQILENGDTGFPSSKIVNVTRRPDPTFRSVFKGTPMTGKWNARTGHSAFEVWIAYDGPTNGVAAAGQAANHRYIVETVPNSSQSLEVFTLPEDAPAGQYRAWVRGIRQDADGNRIADPWSEPDSFSILHPNVEATVDGDAFTNPNPTARWGMIPDATSYVVSVYEVDSGAVMNQSHTYSVLPAAGPVFLRTVTGVDHLQISRKLAAGKYVARVTAVFPTGETKFDDVAFTYAIPTIRSNNGTLGGTDRAGVTANLPTLPSEYSFWVSYEGDHGVGADFDYLVTSIDIPTLLLPADAPAGIYKAWVRVAHVIDGESVHSAWSEPATLSVIPVAEITTPAGSHESFPLIEWTSESSQFHVALWDLTSNEVVVSETVGNVRSWRFNNPVDQSYYRVVVTAITDNGMAGNQSSVDIRYNRLPQIGFSNAGGGYLLSWTRYVDATDYDIWISQDSLDDDAATGNATDNFRYLVETNRSSDSFVMDAETPHGKYRVWIRSTDSGDGPGRWSQALSVTIDGVAEIPVRIVGGITDSVVGVSSDFGIVNSLPTQVAELTAEPLPTPAAPVVVSIVPNQSGGSGRQIMWVDRSPNVRQGDFRTPDGLAVSMRLISQIEIAIVDINTGASLNLNGVTLPNGVTASSILQDSHLGGAIFSSVDTQILANKLNLADGAYEIQMRMRNLQTFTEFSSSQANSNFLVGIIGDFAIRPSRFPDSQVRAVYSDWSLWSKPLSFQTGTESARPEFLTAQQNGSTLNWSMVAGASRYEVAFQNLQTGEHIRRVILQTTFNAGTLNVPAGNYRAWVRALSPGGIESEWSQSTNVTIRSSSSTADASDALATVMASLPLDGLLDSVRTNQRGQGVPG